MQKGNDWEDLDGDRSIVCTFRKQGRRL